ncbi:hypothetical protein T230_11790 [Tannerella sp. oral taxon BU063 isolate Cell 1/3]|uniref:Uncharacterized protein n=1 Tax=Tannerella sp. oral taxon BU063 isolate Cell 1/3 TaxID=1411022 RepID=W2CJB0_9BACT|nr:hypothetical protein T230_11790 [Tannerella sp. oral taxon BU063 isolate Cell 1/3]
MRAPIGNSDILRARYVARYAALPIENDSQIGTLYFDISLEHHIVQMEYSFRVSMGEVLNPAALQAWYVYGVVGSEIFGCRHAADLNLHNLLRRRCLRRDGSCQPREDEQQGEEHVLVMCS